MRWCCSRVQTVTVSENPDFTSILRVDGKIFSVTQFESPRPGVAYVSELEQASDGRLTVKKTIIIARGLQTLTCLHTRAPCVDSLTVGVVGHVEARMLRLCD